ncbi:MAG: hypothetical protein AAF411_27435, partial [Myxococcota bacterium]
ERTGQLEQYPPQLVTIGRDIWEIDAALADVLLIDPPAVPNSQVARHLLERFASATRRLGRELELAPIRERGRGFSSWGLTQECDRLSTAASLFGHGLGPLPHRALRVKTRLAPFRPL